MKAKIKKFSQDTFSSLATRNFRLYFIGQSISMAGTFMQGIALAWLVLKMTNSGTALGVAVSLQYLPILLLGPWGGMVADRFSKRALLIMTKSAFGILAFSLGILVLTGIIQVWMIFLLSLATGIISLIDSPAYYAFIPEMVEGHKIKNAITLNASMLNLSRVAGPAVAGILIATTGFAPCFILNGASYIVIIIALSLINKDELHKGSPLPKSKGMIWEGFRHVLSKPILAGTIVMIAIIGTLTYEFPVSLALLAKTSFHGSPSSYAALTGALGLGSVLGGLFHASRKIKGSDTLAIAAFVFGCSVILISLMPTLFLAVGVMVLVGACSIWFATLANSTLQLNSDPQLRGRVMVLWSMSYLGSTAIGGPLIGWVGEHAGPRWSLGVGGLAAIVAAALGIMVMRNQKRSLAAVEVVTLDAEIALSEDKKMI
ncbi:MAG: MFS transporter [Parcubacteria group bacterium]|jgi:MFS family permease